MNIKKKFLQLTGKTYPHGCENQLKNHLPKGFLSDIHGNFYLKIGETSTMFTCHLDTADRTQKKVTHVIEGEYIKTDGNSILGADDKAGMTIMLYMIENKIPGLYYFFIGEERGCVGSGRLSKSWTETEFSKYITKCISFDRRGTDSIITEQLYGVCCSLEFADELSERLNSTQYGFKYSPDPTGIYTDSAKFTSLIPECTNISVGYYNEHSPSERQDIEHLEKLCKACIEIDWETLPISKKVDESDCDLDDYDLDDDDYDLDDDDFLPQNFTYVKLDGKVKKAMISNHQIRKEEEIILKWLKESGLYHTLITISWDGQSLYGADYTGKYEFIAKRDDIMNDLEELRSIPSSHLRVFK